MQEEFEVTRDMARLAIYRAVRGLRADPEGSDTFFAGFPSMLELIPWA
jgi:hypothetical protein